MPPLTPQERQALIVVALLIASGAVGRHLVTRAEAGEWLAYSAEVADSVGRDSGSGLQARVEAEVALERIRSRPLGAGEKIDPNRAPPEQLDRLPRVGAALAERIVADREAHGPFRSLADLDRVSGIGPAMLEALAPHLDFAESPALARATSSGGSIAAGLTPLIQTAGTGLVSARSPPAGSGLTTTNSDRRIDLNRATATELEALPGVGPAIAARIVEFRREHGPFATFGDLERVSGIGPRLRERIEEAARL